MDMSGTGPGYSQTIIITPYMHNLVYHVPTSKIWHCTLGQGCFKHSIGRNPECTAQSNSRPYHQQVNGLFLSFPVSVIKSITFVTLYHFVLQNLAFSRLQTVYLGGTWALGKKNRHRIMPACIVTAIRKTFPEESGSHVGF